MMSASHLREAFDRWSKPLWDVMRSSVVKIRTSAMSTAAGFQTAAFKARAGESDEGVEHYEQYGFTSHPPAGSAGLYIAIGGDPEHGVVINIGNREHRLKDLEEGETAQYSAFECSLVMNKDGEIVVTSKEGATLTLDKDGAIKGVAKEGQSFDLDSTGQVILTGKETQTVTLDAAGDIVVEPKAAKQLKIGSTASDRIVTADLLHAYLLAMLGSGVPGPADGGAALRTAWVSYLGANPSSAFAAAKGVAE